MKKTYMKPSLRVEIFEVDTIMEGGTTPTPTPLAASNILQGQTYIIEGAGEINFNDNNTLQSIDYRNFMN